MRSIVFIATSFVFAGLNISGASAHPGPELLTAGGANERTAMTAGMSLEETNGVHVFRGTPLKKEASTAPEAQKIEVEIELQQPAMVWRRLRHMRTQGFYSGNAYPSRRYTQGFYSGR